ncbi:MAG: hypothetical protein ABSC02_07680 [Acidobacteriota bacterium]
MSVRASLVMLDVLHRLDDRGHRALMSSFEGSEDIQLSAGFSSWIVVSSGATL